METDIGDKKRGAIHQLISGSTGHAFLFIFAVSFLLRAGFLFLAPAEYFLPDSGYEVGAVAQSLATTGQFADPHAQDVNRHCTGLSGLLFSQVQRGFVFEA